MSKKQSKSAFDDAQILKVSQRIVDKALQPHALAEYILNDLDENQPEELHRLRTAIDDRYLEFRKRFEKGERGDVATELTIIDEQTKFHVGVAVGRRGR
jgi:hypothetical protein